MTSSTNTRIAKNTVLLYIRMIFTLVISLYTSRKVLAVLGEDDFGIFNVVGGVVVLFSFLTNAMTTSTQRFLNYSIGKKDHKATENVFNTSILIHLTILGLIFILAETLGLWFVTSELNIPTSRYEASVWVYQASVLSTLLNIIVVPYRASIIATEKMESFALISILEVILKLVIVLILPLFQIDNLILYSILLTAANCLVFVVYMVVCRKCISFTRFHFTWDKKQFCEQMSFSGWYLFGGVATVGSKQGINILINIFYNVAVNAAVGIANQVRSAIYGFVSSFQVAFNPQIVKLYASEEYNKLLSLIYQTSKFSFYLLFILALPIIVFCEEVLSLWLVDVPSYAVLFTQLVLVASFTEALSAPLWTAIGATGNVRSYQIIVSIIILLDIPIVYFIFTLGLSPIWAYIVNLLISICAYIYRLLYVRKYVNYKLSTYFCKVLMPCCVITIFSSPIVFLLHKMCTSSICTILSICLSFIIIAVVIYFLGLNKEEKVFLVTTCERKFKNIIKRGL